MERYDERHWLSFLDRNRWEMSPNMAKFCFFLSDVGDLSEDETVATLGGLEPIIRIQAAGHFNKLPDGVDASAVMTDILSRVLDSSPLYLSLLGIKGKRAKESVLESMGESFGLSVEKRFSTDVSACGVKSDTINSALAGLFGFQISETLEEAAFYSGPFGPEIRYNLAAVVGVFIRLALMKSPLAATVGELLSAMAYIMPIAISKYGEKVYCATFE